MEAKQPEFLRRRIAECVQRGLADAPGAINPTTYGPEIRATLPKPEQDEILGFGALLIDALFAAEAREQTRGRPPADDDQVEAFPLDTWISAKTAGERVRYRRATWEDHQAHREHQIANVRRVTRAFDVEEERRSQLRAAGMAEDPTLTTEDAVRRLRGDVTDAAAD